MLCIIGRISTLFGKKQVIASRFPFPVSRFPSLDWRDEKREKRLKFPVKALLNGKRGTLQTSSFRSWLGLLPVDFWTKRENDAAEE